MRVYVAMLPLDMADIGNPEEKEAKLAQREFLAELRGWHDRARSLLWSGFVIIVVVLWVLFSHGGLWEAIAGVVCACAVGAQLVSIWRAMRSDKEILSIDLDDEENAVKYIDSLIDAKEKK